MDSEKDSMPVVTRMLLANDGSTTRLLETLTGRSLRVRVDAQGFVDTDRLSDEIKTALALPPAGDAMERRSCLVTEEHEVVSMNLVVFDSEAIDRLGEPDVLKPIGHQLRDQQVPQFRHLVNSGRTTWGGEHARIPCPYKAYVIRYAWGGRVYVHERFSPEWVPLRAGCVSRSIPCWRNYEGYLGDPPSCTLAQTS